MQEPYYAEDPCGAVYKSGAKKGQGCGNKAYYVTDAGEYRCGTHSKKDQRRELAKNPNAAKQKEEDNKDREQEAVTAAAVNLKKGQKGDVICSKLRMRKEAPHVPGYLSIFPNFKHENRGDGIGLKNLSPMSLGPIVHNQPGLPPSKNLENFHQGSKVFKSELLEDGSIGPAFYETQLAMFNDSTPHRHKEVAKEIDGNKNICHFWVWKRQDGTIKTFSYIESRQFYCNYYERLATQEADFKDLVLLRDSGYNLNIIGYDGRDVGELEAMYLDPSAPFGHELCLVALLVLSPEQYPWRKYKTEEF